MPVGPNPYTELFVAQYAELSRPFLIAFIQLRCLNPRYGPNPDRPYPNFDRTGYDRASRGEGEGSPEELETWRAGAINFRHTVTGAEKIWTISLFLAASYEKFARTDRSQRKNQLCP